jgi:hypothetical protein
MAFNILSALGFISVALVFFTALLSPNVKRVSTWYLYICWPGGHSLHRRGLLSVTKHTLIRHLPLRYVSLTRLSCMPHARCELTLSSGQLSVI